MCTNLLTTAVYLVCLMLKRSKNGLFTHVTYFDFVSVTNKVHSRTGHEGQEEE